MRPWAIAFLFFFACHPIQPFEAPPPPSGEARSAIVAFDGEELVVIALELSGPDPLTRPFASSGDAIITVLYLMDDLASMQLEAGRIAPAVGPPTRSLPPFLAAYQSAEEAGVVRFSEIEALSDRLAKFRLPGFDIDACAEVGGCYLDEAHASVADCTVPCPIAKPALPESARPPRLPELEPCPPGFRPRQLESLLVCEPSALAELCPSGEYAEGLSEPIVYVSPGGTALADAVATVSAGTTLALAKGVHTGGVIVDRELSIVGACAAETIVEVPADQIGFAVLADATLRGLTIRGGATAVQATSGAITLEDAVVEDTSSVGIWAIGASASLRRVLVQRTVDRAIATEGSRLETHDLSLRDGGSYGLELWRSTAALERTLMERNVGCGLSADSSTIAASDLVIHTVEGAGLRAFSSSVTLSRASLFAMEWVGVVVGGDSELSAADLSIARVVPSFEGGQFVVGLELADQSRSRIERFAASEIDGEGMLAFGDAVATLDDVTIERDGDTPDQLGTQCGFNVFGKSNVTAHRVHLERLLRQGLCVNSQATGTITDVTAVDVGDHGLYVFEDGSLRVERALVDGAADGVVAFLRTQLDVSDLTVRRMHGNARYVPRTMLGYPRGRGIYNNAMARVRVTRFEVSGCEDAGLDLSARDSVSLVDGWVTDNQIGARTTFDRKHLLERVRVSGNRQNFADE